MRIEPKRKARTALRSKVSCSKDLFKKQYAYNLQFADTTVLIYLSNCHFK